MSYETNKVNTPQRYMWQFPWRYREGFVLALSLFIVGVGLEFILTGFRLPLPPSPISLYLCISLFFSSCILYFLTKKHPIGQWLGSTPAALSSIAYMLFMVIIMGLFLQDGSQAKNFFAKLGFHDITRSWPFLLSYLYLVLTLSFVTLKRTFPLKKKNISFMITHWGLWLILLTAGSGSGDIRRWQMRVDEGHVALQAKDEKDQLHDMPFKIFLEDFQIDEYYPKMTIVNSKTSEVLKDKGQFIFSVDSVKQVKLHGYDIEIEEYLPYAAVFGRRFVKVYETGATSAAKIKVSKDGKVVSHGWLSAGTYVQPAFVLPISEELELAMTLPEVKKYHSDVEITTSNGEVIKTTLEVNKAIRVEGWKIYQLDYDADMGRWSTYSVFELVYDPWQTYVYIGIFMTLFGTLAMMWQGTFPAEDKAKKGIES